MYLDMYVYAQPRYTVATTGMKSKIKYFYTREDATQYMYRLANKHGLSLKKIYDDNEDKTYIYNNNVRFYIQKG